MLSHVTGLRTLILGLLYFWAANGLTATGQPVANKIIILATTTSTQDSGLLDLLVPLFQIKTSYVVKTIAVGTGQALAMGRRGDADVLLVHAPEEENKFMAGGHGIKRQPFMYNDFVLVGPTSDPAKLVKAKSAAEALRRIAASKTLFLSRGDNSGTHILEKQLWMRAGIQPAERWHQQSGQGMGQTLIIASEKSAYTLTDRATYLKLKRRIELTILLEGDRELLNTYSLLQVNPLKSSKINSAGAQAFVDFMLAPETLDLIRTFGLEQYGQPLFHLLKK
ncbi:MAG: substrate-binding domain-containing protein [Deltaproteobacteria bacterium]|nr:substrate-binding domain-containing protein [Deltaproteobacteria bacterium]